MTVVAKVIFVSGFLLLLAISGYFGYRLGKRGRPSKEMIERVNNRVMQEPEIANRMEQLRPRD